ncbi:MAG TPA: ABC transporter ATP-binding protein [Woeseiaceae bacterium]|nr:ABC transporter ATP-binding protein [Woeseiaceae bacterium]
MEPFSNPELRRSPDDCVVEARDLSVHYGDKRVLEGINVKVRRGEVLAIVGGSGSGKSTLMRQLALLATPTAGTVRLFGDDVASMKETELNLLRQRLGVMFQHGALFGDQTVLENVSLPLREHTRLSRSMVEQTAMLKIALAGLMPDAAALYPNQLSGGMRKRAAVARSIALDPQILFLDEPSSGLDPISADAIDELVLDLRAALGLTVILVTHDMNSLWRVADRILYLADARIAAEGTIRELMRSENKMAIDFFHSRRAKTAGAANGQ